VPDAIYDTPNYRRLRRHITFAVRHKFLTCDIVGIAFALSGVGMGALKQQIFPTSDPPTASGILIPRVFLSPL
jgi:multidrug efflux pump subunit AcrB